MKVPAGPKGRPKAAYHALERHLARKRDALAWRETEALIRRVSGSSLAIRKPRPRKKTAK